jgi:hypothetical protein
MMRLLNMLNHRDSSRPAALGMTSPLMSFRRAEPENQRESRRKPNMYGRMVENAGCLRCPCDHFVLT